MTLIILLLATLLLTVAVLSVARTQPVPVRVKRHR